MNRKRNRHGVGPTEEGKKRMRILKHQYENTKNRSPCDLAEELIRENIPEQLECYTPILARFAAGEMKSRELGFACKWVVELVVREVRRIGYNMEDASESKKIRAWVNFSDERNILEIINCKITCPDREAGGVKQEVETKIFDQYGIKVKLSPSS